MFKLFRLTLVLVAATTTSYAASDHSSSVTLDTAIRAGATSIPAGHYTLHWTADSGDTDLSLYGEKHQYTIPVTVNRSPVKQTGTHPEVLTHNDGNTQVLEGIQVKDTVLTVR